MFTPKKTIHILERCSGKRATMHAIKTSGYLKLNQKCSINANKISIRQHINTKIESLEIIELTEATNNLTLEALSKMTEQIPESADLNSDENILIHKHSEDYTQS